MVVRVTDEKETLESLMYILTTGSNWWIGGHIRLYDNNYKIFDYHSNPSNLQTSRYSNNRVLWGYGLLPLASMVQVLPVVMVIGFFLCKMSTVRVEQLVANSDHNFEIRFAPSPIY
ncbi:MAG: hypothetical protein CM15mV11_2910 [Caudoviricetes sp.]|nr:MAG: hypothetical protein CM15mV11_2910 [Caudoviricetes sp.]